MTAIGGIHDLVTHRDEVDILTWCDQESCKIRYLYILYFKWLTSKGEMGPVNNY